MASLRFRHVVTRALAGSVAPSFLVIAALTCAASARADDAGDLPLGPLVLLANEPSVVEIGAGVFDVAREEHWLSHGTPAAFAVALRLGGKAWYAGPMLGALANHQGGVYGYGGFYFDFSPIHARRWRLSPSFGVGGYRRGEGKPLTHTLAFQVAGTVTYDLDGRSRLGLTVSHISNAFIYNPNPGAESILLTYAVAFDWPERAAH